MPCRVGFRFQLSKHKVVGTRCTAMCVVPASVYVHVSMFVDGSGYNIVWQSQLQHTNLRNSAIPQHATSHALPCKS